jgi:hypothetical protein
MEWSEGWTGYIWKISSICEWPELRGRKRETRFGDDGRCSPAQFFISRSAFSPPAIMSQLLMPSQLWPFLVSCSQMNGSNFNRKQNHSSSSVSSPATPYASRWDELCVARCSAEQPWTKPKEDSRWDPILDQLLPLLYPTFLFFLSASFPLKIHLPKSLPQSFFIGSWRKDGLNW